MRRSGAFRIRVEHLSGADSFVECDESFVSGFSTKLSLAGDLLLLGASPWV